MNYYEVYGKRSGNLLARGTARECREQLGLASSDSFYTIASRAMKGEHSIYTVKRFKGGETDYPVLGKEYK